MALPRVAAAAAAPFTAAGRAAGSAASNTARAALAAAAGPELLAIRTSLTSTVQGIVRSVRGEYSRLAAANDASSESLDDIKKNTSGFSTSIDSLIDVVRSEVVPPLLTMGNYFQDLAEKLSRQRAIAGLPKTTTTQSDDEPGVADSIKGKGFGKNLFGFLGGLADGLWSLFKKFWIPLGLAGLLLLAKNAFLEGNSEFAKRIKNAIDLSIIGGISGFLIGGIPGMIVGGVLGAALGALVDSETINRFTTVEGITNEITKFLGISKNTLYTLAGGAAIGAGIGGIAGFLALGLPGAIVGIIVGSAIGTIVGYSFLPAGDDKDKIDGMIANMLGLTVNKLREKFSRLADAAGIGAIIGGGVGLVGGPVGVIAGAIIGAGLGAVIGYKWDDWFPSAENTDSWFNFNDFKQTMIGGLGGALGAGTIVGGAALAGMKLGILGGPVGILVGFLLGAAIGYAMSIIDRSVKNAFGSWDGLSTYIFENVESMITSISNAINDWIDSTKARIQYFFTGRSGAQESIEESEQKASSYQTMLEAMQQKQKDAIAAANEAGTSVTDFALDPENIKLNNQIRMLQGMILREQRKQQLYRDLIQEKDQDAIEFLEKMQSGEFGILGDQMMRMGVPLYNLPPGYKNLTSFTPNLRTNPNAIGTGSGGQPIIMINNNQSYPQVYQNNSRQSVVNQSSSTFIRRSSVPVAQMI
jgi:F0F1-type ATP synthase membrane subunit b/b'